MPNQLGEKIRQTRKRLKLTLKDLSARSGLSVSQLSKLENGKQRLSVDMALKLAGVLHVPVASFMSGSRPNGLARRSITRAGMGVRHASEGISFEVLCSDFADKRNVFWRVTVTAFSFEAAGGWRSHSGEEFLQVLSGRLQLHTRHYEPLVLEVGDSILFDGEMEHAYVALDGTPALLLMSNTMIEPEAASTEEP